MQMSLENFDVRLLKHEGLLRTYARNFTRNEEDANFLVRNTLLKAVSGFDKFSNLSDLKKWLYAIMDNIVINNYHRLLRTVRRTVGEFTSGTSANVSSSAGNAGVKFSVEDIKPALQNLPGEYYVPVIMFFEGHRYQVIADHLTISAETVKNRIQVARKLLKSSVAN